MPTLIRFFNSPFTRGVILNGHDVLCHTLELPWYGNLCNVSSIPEGVYDVTRSLSYKHGHCLRFASVPNRTGILIHSGNTIKDTQGCILVGLDANSTSVLNSKDALKRLLTILPESFKLHIKDI